MPAIAYNDIAGWRVTGCLWLLGLVNRECDNLREFDEALKRSGGADMGVYLEVVLHAFASTSLSLKLHEAMQVLYRA